MPIWLALLLSLAVVFAVAVFVWIVWRTAKSGARMRRTLDVVMLRVMLPKDIKPDEREEGIGQEIKERISVAEQWLSTLADLPASRLDRLLYGRPLLVLEIVARSDGVIAFYAGTERKFADHLEKQIYAFYPEASISEMTDYTIFVPGDEFYLGKMLSRRADYLPIATYKELEVDPMQAITGALAKIQHQDAAVVQYVCRPATERTRKKGQSAARKTTQGKQSSIGAKQRGFFRGGRRERERRQADQARLTPRAQQQVELVEDKVSQQQFDVNIRIGVATQQRQEAERIYTAIVGSFAQYELPDLNGLKETKVGKSKPFLRDIIFRMARQRTANTFSTTELASLFHFPLPTTATPNIEWRGAKVAPLPVGLPTKGVKLGDNVYRGVSQPVYLAPNDRRRHLYMIGQTGTGKTTLFLNMIIQDIVAGHGVGVVDPHGDLIEDIMLHVPAERVNDVILFDPTDTDRPLGFNILESQNAEQRDLIVNEVVQVLSKLAARLNPESIGPMFEHYLRNALLALAEDPESTLIDVPRMFIDDEFRRVILAKGPDPTVRQFWEKEFLQSQKGQMAADMLSYVISKLGRFISNSTVRNMIGQPKSSFDVRQVMDEGKILLCNLSKGNLGDINSDLLGFVLVSKIQIAAMGRASMPESERRDFYLYLDEFQNFTTDSISTILSEARKYRLNLNMTHQFIQQLDDTIRDAVFGNVGTIVSYRIGVDDAEFMAKQFDPVFSEYDLTKLDRFTASVRLLAEGVPVRPFSLSIPPPPAGGNPEIRDQIRGHSRRVYGRPRAEVEERILSRYNLSAGLDKPGDNHQDDDYLSESLFDVS
ncbi:type IV secretion system DNA-binding domain-containing protein [Patescibacteria group bacterium]|nr:type IV secretion system DNA-binding domain-containing protein [Patescibacteria group bacterium]